MTMFNASRNLRLHVTTFSRIWNIFAIESEREWWKNLTELPSILNLFLGLALLMLCECDCVVHSMRMFPLLPHLFLAPHAIFSCSFSSRNERSTHTHTHTQKHIYIPLLVLFPFFCFLPVFDCDILLNGTFVCVSWITQGLLWFSYHQFDDKIFHIRGIQPSEIYCIWYLCLTYCCLMSDWRSPSKCESFFY